MNPRKYKMTNISERTEQQVIMLACIINVQAERKRFAENYEPNTTDALRVFGAYQLRVI
jgi:hypothetical protein